MYELPFTCSSIGGSAGFAGAAAGADAGTFFAVAGDGAELAGCDGVVAGAGEVFALAVAGLGAGAAGVGEGLLADASAEAGGVVDVGIAAGLALDSAGLLLGMDDAAAVAENAGATGAGAGAGVAAATVFVSVLLGAGAGLSAAGSGFFSGSSFFATSEIVMDTT